MVDYTIRRVLNMLLSGNEVIESAGLDLDQVDGLIALLKEHRRNFFRFEMVEHFNGFAILDKLSGREEWVGDGVDQFFDEDGDAITPGSSKFKELFYQWLESSEAEIEEAYGFPSEDKFL